LDFNGGLTIGSDVNISSDVWILTTEHDPNSPCFEGRSRSVSIGDRVWIASRATVLPGCALGDGVVVGAGSVVGGDIPPWTIVSGNPAREIGTRSRDAQTKNERYARFLH
jgi:maltose O-acetyltransferase